MSNRPRRNVILAVVASIQHVTGFHSLGYSCSNLIRRLHTCNARITSSQLTLTATASRADNDEDGELYPSSDVNSMTRLYSTADTNNNNNDNDDNDAPREVKRYSKYYGPSHRAGEAATGYLIPQYDRDVPLGADFYDNQDDQTEYLQALQIADNLPTSDNSRTEVQIRIEQMLGIDKSVDTEDIASSTQTIATETDRPVTRKALDDDEKALHYKELESTKSIASGDFNVVLTHCTADFDSLASAVGLAKLWSSPHANAVPSTDSDGTEADTDTYDDYDTRAIPTYVILPRGAHPAVHRFLSLHKHLFPIRSLRSLPTNLSGLQRLGLCDAQRRDRVGPAEHLLSAARSVTIVDHHIDSDSDITEATNYIVDSVGSVSTMIVERLRTAGIPPTEAEATLLALGIHTDTGSLCFDNTTPRDAKALGWVLERGASQPAIAEHARQSLSGEQQIALKQALINIDSVVVHGVTVSTVLLSTDGFINGLAAVTQDALELSSSDIMLLSVVYDANQKKRQKKKKGILKSSKSKSSSISGSSGNGKNDKHSQKKRMAIISSVGDQVGVDARNGHSEAVNRAEAWKGGEGALKNKRLRSAFDKKDFDGSGFLERGEISWALASSGILASSDSVDSIMSEIDTDSDGKVDFDEFVAFANRAENLQKEEEEKTGRRASNMIIIGRVKTGVSLKGVNLNDLFQRFGGGGHAKAASCTVRLGDESEAGDILQDLVQELIDTSLLEQPTVGNFMTAPVLFAKPEMTESQVEEYFSQYDVRALPVVDDDHNVIGLVTYKEVAAAKQRLWNKEQKRLRQKEKEDAAAAAAVAAGGEGNHLKSDVDTDEESKRKRNERQLGSAVKGWMKQHITVVSDKLTMPEVESILLENDVGCIPVVSDGSMQLVGMLTRTDLLRQHKYYPSLHYHNKGFSDSIAKRKPIIELRKKLKQFDLENE